MSPSVGRVPSLAWLPPLGLPSKIVWNRTAPAFVYGITYNRNIMARYLGEFEHSLLAALAHLGDGAYTVTIRTFLETSTERMVSPGAIYTALSRLERRGCVNSRFGEPTPERGGKRKKFYGLEASGAKALKQSQERLNHLTRGLAPKLRSL